MKYIANGIPCNMLHTIYREVCKDLDREYNCGGERKAGAHYCAPVYNPSLYMLTTKTQSHKLDEFIMANLFNESDPTDMAEKEFSARHVGNLSPLDGKRILDLALKLEVDKAKNYARTDIRPDGHEHVCSIDILTSQNKKRFTSLTKVIFDALKRCVPDFDGSEYDSIQCNFNQLMKKHTDNSNNGPSLVFAVGDYEDGELALYEEHHLSPNTYSAYDIQNRVLQFSGLIPHAVHKISPSRKGAKPTRISFVLYRRAQIDKPALNWTSLKALSDLW